MSNIAETLRANLVAAMEERDWSGRELARRADVSHTALHDILNGSEVRLGTLGKIARALDVKVATLLEERAKASA